MAKIKTKEQYALEFFKENPKVKTLWANPSGEFFTDINYANNSLGKDENGKFEKLQVFTSESVDIAKEIIEETAIVPVNPIVPEVINTLKFVETLEDEDTVDTVLLVDKTAVKTTVVDANKKEKTATVKKGKKSEVFENKTSLDEVIGKIDGKPDVSELV